MWLKKSLLKGYTRRWVLEQVREKWAASFKPPPPPPPPPTTTASAAEEPEAKKRKTTSLFAIMASARKPAAAAGTAINVQVQRQDELEHYLERAQEPQVEGFDVLGWWYQHRGMYPNLVKMVLEVLSCPLTSAGVERLFSAAGRMMGDEQKSKLAETMKHQLFAGQLKE